jgi:hypothetical protein
MKPSVSWAPLQEAEGPEGDGIGVELDRLAMIVEGGVQLHPLHHATTLAPEARTYRRGIGRILEDALRAPYRPCRPPARP